MTYLSAFFLLYAISLFLIAPLPSFWLDELLQLVAVRDFSFLALMEYVPVNIGGVPLGYIVQFATIKLLGYSVLSTRLPSIAFSLGSCYGILVLSRRLRIRQPLLAVVLFACFPLQLRYAVEARPYAQALFLSTWSTVAFFALIDNPTWKRTVPYFLCIVAGLYTQPYTLFVPCAHVLWLLLARERHMNRTALLWTSTAILAASLSFLPWYLYASPIWRQGIQEYYQFTAKSLLMVCKELVGAGYIGSALTLTMAGFGIASLDRRNRVLWILYVVLPIFMAILANALFGYYLAIRQMIFVLAPLALLAALGLEQIGSMASGLSAFLTAALVLTLLIGDVSFLRREREDWKAAANVLDVELKDKDCVVFVPFDSVKFYRFFQPDLASRQCALDHRPEGKIAVAVSPYESKESYELLRKQLGLTGPPSRAMDFHGPRIDFYEH